MYDDIKVTTFVSKETLSDILCSAFDPGYSSTGYWAHVLKKTEPTHWDYADKMRPESGSHWRHEYPLNPGGSLLIEDMEEDKTVAYTLDFDAVKKGIRVMAEKYPKHFSDVMRDNHDGDTADVLVQCALFGEIRYS